MSLLCAIALAAVLLILGIMIIAGLLLQSVKATKPRLPDQWPSIAILLAVRNEAPNLPRCLQAIAALDYPADKLNVLIGNDASEDDTKAIAEAFCHHKPGWKVLDIQECLGQAKGKANVLAQLAHAAGKEPEFFFITDADIAVSPSWLKSIISHFKADTGIVSGISVVEGNSFTARMQRYDWVLVLGLTKAYSLLPRGKTLTATGNNMAVRREAYQTIGGYASIPFSVTEDFELHRQLSRKGYKNQQIISPFVKAKTLPTIGWKNLLHQRRRWMEGALQLPWPMVTILFIQALFLPAILLLLYHHPLLATSIWLVKIAVQSLLINKVFRLLQEPPELALFGFECYTLAVGLSLVVFYLLPLNFSWKGRRY